MNVLLSIRPQYAEAIMNESKRYEFRRSLFRSSAVEHIFVYSTSPVQMVVEAFGVGRVIQDDPLNLWRMLHEHAGIEEVDFFRYFGGRNEGFAIEVRNPREFGEPIDPWEMDPDFVPPQSFRYVDWTLSEEGQLMMSGQR